MELGNALQHGKALRRVHDPASAQCCVFDQHRGGTLIARICVRAREPHKCVQARGAIADLTDAGIGIHEAALGLVLSAEPREQLPDFTLRLNFRRRAGLCGPLPKPFQLRGCALREARIQLPPCNVREIADA